jgi:hypothetical protein
LDVERLGDPAVLGGGVSVTPTVKRKVPLVVGVPLSVPVLLFKLKPGGAGLINQVYVPGRPSAALNVTEYGVPVVPPGSGDEFVMFRIPTV